MSAISMYHESIERQPFGLNNKSYIEQVMSVDYYDDLMDVCTYMCDKYGCNTGRNETHHVCAFINTKDGKCIIGENSNRQMPGRPISTHAEMDVLRKIMKTKNGSIGTNKRIERYDVLVIRISKTNKLGISRPCYHCINSMINNSMIKIRHVYYSTNDGRIVRERLEDMLDCELTCLSTGWRERTGKRRDGSPSGYSSEDSDDSYKSSKSNKSNSSKKSWASNNSNNIRVINPETGERYEISEKKFYSNKKK